jgi:hypothetical protein
VLRSSHGRDAAFQANDAHAISPVWWTTDVVLVRSQPPDAWFAIDVVGFVAVHRRGEHGGFALVGERRGRCILRWLGMHDVGEKGLLSMMSRRGGVGYG